mgnify:CR=1 FL=1
MPKKLTQQKINKIYKAHEKGMSTPKAAEYIGVSQRTIVNYWNKKGLEVHFEVGRPISQQQETKVYKAHEKGMSILKAAEYAKVSQPTVIKYWNKKGLEAHFEVGGKIRS